ncbi:hypothetical protein [Dactylosporangium sp. CA-139066]|uniref:hypothetical protein n=1 Tax=Dactylosporangium sp. CA-139066 TaxID=3239930 RepID=UPI003D9308F4
MTRIPHPMTDRRPSSDARRPGPAPRHVRAVLALAWFEGLRLVRRPVVVAALLVLCPLWYLANADRAWRFAVLYEADQWLQPPGLLLGGVALIASNLAVTRAHRDGATALLDVLTLPLSRRVGAHLVALLPLTAVAGVFVAGHIAVLAALDGSVGRPRVFELATGPAVVLLSGAVGVLLGRIVRGAFVAPLLTVAFVAYTIISLGMAPTGGSNPNWFVPVIGRAGGDPEFGLPPLPPALMARPAGWHLMYLLGVAALVATLALLLARCRRGVAAVAAAAALLVTGVAGTAQAGATGRGDDAALIAATRRPGATQTCERIARVTYCSFAGFEPWVEQWDAVARGVSRQTPAAVSEQPLAVRQRLDAYAYSRPGGSPAPGTVPVPAPLESWQAEDRAAGIPNAITASTRWGDGWSEASLAARLAYELITRSGPGAQSHECGARGVLIGWLAGQATPATGAGLRRIAEFSGGRLYFAEANFPTGIGLSDRVTASGGHASPSPPWVPTDGRRTTATVGLGFASTPARLHGAAARTGRTSSDPEPTPRARRCRRWAAGSAPLIRLPRSPPSASPATPTATHPWILGFSAGPGNPTPSQPTTGSSAAPPATARPALPGTAAPSRPCTAGPGNAAGTYRSCSPAPPTGNSSPGTAPPAACRCITAPSSPCAQRPCPACTPPSAATRSPDGEARMPGRWIRPLATP